LTEKKGQRDKDQGSKCGCLTNIYDLRHPGRNPPGTIQTKYPKDNTPERNHENQEGEIDFKRGDFCIDRYDA